MQPGLFLKTQYGGKGVFRKSGLSYQVADRHAVLLPKQIQNSALSAVELFYSAVLQQPLEDPVLYPLDLWDQKTSSCFHMIFVPFSCRTEGLGCWSKEALFSPLTAGTLTANEMKISSFEDIVLYRTIIVKVLFGTFCYLSKPPSRQPAVCKFFRCDFIIFFKTRSMLHLRSGCVWKEKLAGCLSKNFFCSRRIHWKFSSTAIEILRQKRTCFFWIFFILTNFSCKFFSH